ncbi:hypothetical protein [Dongia sp. agr-C8]
MNIEERMMVRIAIAVLLLALTGCVAPMPTGDEDNRLLNQSAPPDGAPTAPWMPRMIFE